MARPSSSYEPRDPASSVLHQIVQDHLETFLARTSQLRDGGGVPAFVERAFRESLGCGSWQADSRGCTAACAAWTGSSPSRASGARFASRAVPIRAVCGGLGLRTQSVFSAATRR